MVARSASKYLSSLCAPIKAHVERMVSLATFSQWFSILLVTSASMTDQNYSEDLFIKHLMDGRVMAKFDFVTKWDVNPVNFARATREHHYGIFPKSLAEIVSHYSVQEVHLSLTQGKWRTRMWGYPPSSTPPGAELWAWFLPFADSKIEWSGLVNAMSGLVCAHLNDIGPPSTYQPHYSFQPEGAVVGNVSYSQLRYAALPRESVCTENFTPWTKLLPCGSTAGLATLFSALKLYDSDYHSLGLHFAPVCLDTQCSGVGVQLQQSLTVVFQPSTRNGHTEWSFSSLFSRSLLGPCPLSSSSRVFLEAEVVNGNLALVVTPPPSSTLEREDNGDTENKRVWMIYDVENATRHGSLDLNVKSSTKVSNGMPSPPLLTVHRSLRGSGHEWGGLYTDVTNHHPSSGIKLLYLDMIPWYCRVYIHTLVVENGTIVSSHYEPSKDRQKPQMLEMVLHIPPSTSTAISFEFNRAFLKWTEHPPDAHHGFYINSAVLTTIVPECDNCTINYRQLFRSNHGDARSGTLLRLHTDLLLISLPTPDFSMPYNVICFVCTVIAIGFGSIFNLTTRVLVPVSKDDKGGILSRISTRVKLLFQKHRVPAAVCKTINSDVEKKRKEVT